VIKSRILSLIMFLTLALSFLPHGSAQYTGFILKLGTDQSLRVQTLSQRFTLRNTGALLNGSDSSLTFGLESGTLSFMNEFETTVELDFFDVPNGIDLVISGGADLEAIEDTNFSNYTATLPAATQINITWSWRLESYLDLYVMPGIGVTGLGMMFGCIIWCGLGFRKYGFDVESVSRVMTAMIIFLIGLGMVWVWLLG
jgi:hypothetical protein